jgi:hypothetical protein
VNVHVKPSSKGAWTVHPDDCPQPLSEHPTETHAERAAARHAAAHGGGRIIVRDCYRREHVAQAVRSDRSQEPGADRAAR